MKIALIHKRLDLSGGTERDLLQTAEGLQARGHEVHLFCSEYGIPPPNGIVAHRVPVVPLGRTLRLWSFDWLGRRAIDEANCDVAIGFGRLQRQDILRCGGGTHRGFLYHLGREGGARRRFWQTISIYHRSVLAIERRQYKATGARTIVAVSEQVKRDILANYSVPSGKIVVLYNGVDLQRFHPAKRAEVRDQVRNRWNIPLDAPLVLFVGSGFRRKGLDSLIAAWNSAGFERVFLLVVGGDARRQGYQSRAEVVAPGRIVFTGRQEDVENYYAAADVVALPSLQEAFGNVVLEALASGVPVLVSRNVGASEVIRGALTAGIVDSMTIAALEEKLLFLLEKSCHSNWGREARILAEQYSWDNYFAGLEALLYETRRMRAGASH